MRTKARLDAIVTVVDAKHGLDRLKDSHEAAEQIGFADIILLNKIDLVGDAELTEIDRAIRAINPFATIYRTKHCGIGVDALLDRGAFDLPRILTIEPNFPLEDEHEHDQDITSISPRQTRPLAGEAGEIADLAGAEREARILGIAPRQRIAERADAERADMARHVPAISEQCHRAGEEPGDDLDDHRHRGERDDETRARFVRRLAIAEEDMLV